MKLDHLYSLRREFTVIGLTGRTGSGCTTIANLLCSNLNSIESKGLRKLEELDPSNQFYRKYSILKNYVQHKDNWVKFSKIKYKHVLILYLFYKHGNNSKYLKRLLTELYKEGRKDENTKAVNNLFTKITEIHKEYKALIVQLQKLSPLTNIKSDAELKELSNIFFGKSFAQFCSKIFEALSSEGYSRGASFLHHIACNIRQSGEPLKS